MKALGLFLVLQLSGIPTLAAEIRGENYFTHCDQLTGMFSKLSPEDTIERRFVDGAKTQGQMAQLLKDYDIIFSKEFGDALLMEVGYTGNKRLSKIRRLRAINSLSPKKFNDFMWRVLDRVVLMKANQKSDPQGQVCYLQAKNLIETLKSSPQRPVAEEVISILIRHTLIRSTKNLIVDYDESSARIKRDIAMPGIFGGALLGTLLAVLAPAHDDLVGSYLMGQVLGGGILAFVTAFVVGPGGANINVRSHVRRLFTKKVDPVDFKFLQDLDNGEKWAAEEAFKFIKEPAKDPKLSLSLKDGCEANACKLTPVQLAYMGHIDLLELEILKGAIQDAMKKYNSENETLRLSELAHDVSKEPRDFMKQMQLKSALIVFVEKMKDLLEAQHKAVDGITEYAINATSQFGVLSQRPYDMEPRTQDEILKTGLLMAKIDSDLKTLESLKVNSSAMASKITHGQKIVQTLTDLIGQLPRSREGWKEAAEEIILRLDELK